MSKYKEICMFCQHALIAYTFPTPTTSHVSLVIQHIPCSLTINNMTYTLTKPKHQIQHFLLNKSSHSQAFLLQFQSVISCLQLVWNIIVIVHSSLSFSNVFIIKITRLWDSVLNNSVIFCFVEVAFGTLLHNFGICYVKLDNVGSCLWQVVR